MAKILVIEDDPAFQDLVRQVLEPAGHSIEIALDGEEGLRRLWAQPSDLVVLDVNLPGMNGFVVCSALRREPATARLPILMLTVDTKPQDQKKGLSSGADDYLGKPFKPEELRARVFALLRRAGKA